MDQELGLRRFFNDSVYNLIRQGISIILGLMTSILIARGLGVKGQGIYAIVLLLPQIVVSFTNLGISTSTVFYVAQGNYPLETIISSNIILSLGIGLLSTLIGYLTIWFAGNTLFPGAPHPLLLLVLALIPLQLLSQNLLSILQGLQDFKTFNTIGLIPQAVMLIGTLVLVWLLHLGIFGAVLANIFGNILAVVMLLGLLKRRAKLKWLLVGFNWDYLRKMVTFGFQVYLANLLSYLSNRVDKFLLNLISGPIALGQYDLSVSTSEQLWVVSRSVSTVLYPRVASMEQNENSRNKLTLLSSRIVFWISIVTSIATLLLAEWMIVLLYGIEFRPAAGGLRLLLPGIFTLGTARILANDIAGRGKPLVNMVIIAISLVFNLAVNLVLIPRMGFRGASIASSISYTLILIMTVAAQSRISGEKWFEAFWPNRDDIRLVKKVVSLTRERLKFHKAAL